MKREPPGVPRGGRKVDAEAVRPRAGSPLDYSFKEITCMDDALYEEAESGSPKCAPLVRVDPENPDAVPPPPHLPPRPNVQLNSIAVRLGNNKLTTLDGLESFLEHVLEDPQALVWLDLSCNRLKGISDVLTKYPNLQVLYLHGNQITTLKEVQNLAALPRLTKLTLHGNPISENPSCRLYAAAVLEQLKSLDFGSITHVDRERINVWMRGHQKRLTQR